MNYNEHISQLILKQRGCDKTFVIILQSKKC